MNHTIRQYGSQLSTEFEQETAHLRRAQSAMAWSGKSVVDKLRWLWQALRSGKNELWKLLTSSLQAIVLTTGKISKCRPLLAAALEQVAGALRRAQGALTRSGKSVADEFRAVGEALRLGKNELCKFQARSREAILVTISKAGSQLSIALHRVIAPFQVAGLRLTQLGRGVAEKPRRLREATRARENELRDLLASSLEAIVVTNGDHRVLATNPKALDLFGVSEKNVSKFTIDVFVSHRQMRLDNSSPFVKGRARHGKCKIRRLDGSSRIAEYVFVANFAPLRHLFKFCEITPQNRSSIPSEVR